jgi:hypothetical protein
LPDPSNNKSVTTTNSVWETLEVVGCDRRRFLTLLRRVRLVRSRIHRRIS